MNKNHGKNNILNQFRRASAALFLFFALFFLVTGKTAAAEPEEIFQFEVTVTDEDKTFQIPTSSYLNGSFVSKAYNWKIVWGDGENGTYIGTSDSYSDGIAHTYLTAGTYTITITPGADTDAWLGAFGFRNHSSRANISTNKMKVTKVISPLTCRMTRTQAELDRGIVPGYEWAYTFYGCKNLTMGEKFNLPQELTTVGDDFASYMFYGCSGTEFSMNDEFNLPQELTTVGDYFAAFMFSGCSGAEFRMNDMFNLPQELTTVGSVFAACMFDGCSGAQFSMNEKFNLPQELTTVGGSFAVSMFDGCSGAEFSMNDEFNLPQELTTMESYFAASMFYGCSGAEFRMNDEFNLPQNLTTVEDDFANSMFYGCSGAEFIMNETFNLPQELTTVGDNFANSMFSGCSGAEFSMNETFNLPQRLTTVGSVFAASMFSGCSGAGFSMNETFNLPQKLTTVGSTFAYSMFYGCGGAEFSMNDEFNLPQELTTVGNYFAGAMFSGCSGAEFSMNETFNLPQELTTVGSYFADTMFKGCSGAEFSMNETFNLPQELTTVGNYFAYSMFYGCSGAGFRMNDEFNLPQNLTIVGDNFAYHMFHGCSGAGFSMNETFNLPQELTIVGSYFAASMFNGCSGAEFSMNETFNLPQKLTTVGNTFAYSMFNGCSGAEFSMNDEFNLPQNLTTVGSSFAYDMFSGCSGAEFRMNDEFNLPQELTTVGNNFAYCMFKGCSGAEFSMNAEFNLPQELITVGDNFADSMFRECSGAGFRMNAEFNLPQELTTVGNNFAYLMFNGCSGAEFSMNDKFNLPQNLTAVGTNFAYGMFFLAGSEDFQINDIFCFPKLSSADLNKTQVFSNVFLFKSSTPQQKRTALSILNGNDIPNSNKKTFQSGNQFKDYNYIPANWGGGGANQEYLIVCEENELTFSPAMIYYCEQPAETILINNFGAKVLTAVSAELTSGSNAFEIVTAPAATLASGYSSSVSVRPKTGLSPGEYTETLRITGDGAEPYDISLSFKVNYDLDLTALTVTKTDETAILLAPEFDSDVLEYLAVVDYDVSQIQLTAELSDADNVSMTLQQGDEAETTALTSQNPVTVDLESGDNQLSITVTGTDGISAKKYLITVKRPAEITTTYSPNGTLSDIELPSGYTWLDGDTLAGDADENGRTFPGIYSDGTNSWEITLFVMVEQAVPSYNLPTDLSAGYGQKLSTVELPAGFSFKAEEGTTVGEVGTNTFTAIYTPTDPNYKPVEVTLSVKVTQLNGGTVATLTATYGQTLADLQLPAGYRLVSPGTTSVGNVTSTGRYIAVVFTDPVTGAITEAMVLVKVTAKTATMSQSGVTLTVSKGNGYIYNGKKWEPKVVVKDGSQTLQNNVDYTVSYKNNKNVGIATVTVKMKGNYSGTLTDTFQIKQAVQKISGVKQSLTKTYSSKSFTLKPKLSGSGTITYQSSNKKIAVIGKNNGKVTLKGYGKVTIAITATSKNYKKVTKKVTLKVIPQKAELTSLTAGSKNAIEVRWKRDKRARGYLLIYSTDASFASKKRVVISGSGSTAKTISGLKANTTYYVKIQAYTKIDGKKVYGKASRVMRVST